MEELRLQIIELCNKSGLSIEPLMFVIRDVYRDVESVYANLKKQQEEAKEEQNDN